MAARLHDDSCRVTIPGFYDRVVQFSDAEIQATRKLEAPREFYEKVLVCRLYGASRIIAFWKDWVCARPWKFTASAAVSPVKAIKQSSRPRR